MRPRTEVPIYKRSLFSWVFKTSVPLQLLLLLLILGVVFLRVLPLEIQKRIINDVLAVGDVSQLLVYCSPVTQTEEKRSCSEALMS